MIQYKQKIRDLTQKIKNISSLIEFKTEELGQSIAGIKGAASDSVKFSETLAELIELKKEIPEKKKMSQRITKIVEFLDSIKKEISETRRSMQAAEKQLQEHHERIGNASYEIYKEHSRELVKYDGIFKTLIELDKKSDEQKGSGDAMYRPPESGTISQILQAAKSIYSNQTYHFTLHKYAKAYRSTGKLIIASEFAGDVQLARFDELITACGNTIIVIEGLGKKSDALALKKTKFEEELISLGVRGSALLRIREIDAERKKLDLVIRKKHASLGQLYLDNPKVLKMDNETVQKLGVEIDKLAKENSRYKSEIKKIEAEIGIESIRVKIERANRKIEQLAHSIARHESDIVTLKAMISHLEKDKQAFEKTVSGK